MKKRVKNIIHIAIGIIFLASIVLKYIFGFGWADILFAVTLAVTCLYNLFFNQPRKRTMNKTVYLAGGCFWGMQKYLKLINGVLATEVGFANGHTESPSYKEVYTDATGHAETVRVEYDADVLDLQDLVRFFFKAEEIGGPPAVECCPLECFYPAEEYHQDYLNKNPQGYCHLRPELFEYAKNLNR